MRNPNFLGSLTDLAGSAEPELGRMTGPQRAAPRSKLVDAHDPAYRKALESPHISAPETGEQLWRVRQKGSVTDNLNAKRVRAQMAHDAFTIAALTSNGASGFPPVGAPLSFDQCDCDVVEAIRPREEDHGKANGAGSRKKPVRGEASEKAGERQGRAAVAMVARDAGRTTSGSASSRSSGASANGKTRGVKRGGR